MLAEMIVPVRLTLSPSSQLCPKADNGNIFVTDFLVKNVRLGMLGHFWFKPSILTLEDTRIS